MSQESIHIVVEPSSTIEVATTPSWMPTHVCLWELVYAFHVLIQDGFLLGPSSPYQVTTIARDSSHTFKGAYARHLRLTTALADTLIIHCPHELLFIQYRSRCKAVWCFWESYVEVGRDSIDQANEGELRIRQTSTLRKVELNRSKLSSHLCQSRGEKSGRIRLPWTSSEIPHSLRKVVGAAPHEAGVLNVSHIALLFLSSTSACRPERSKGIESARAESPGKLWICHRDCCFQGLKVWSRCFLTAYVEALPGYGGPWTWWASQANASFNSLGTLLAGGTALGRR